MTPLSTSPDRSKLASRRQTLRRQRQNRIYRMVWQIVAFSGLIAGSIWLVTRPFWLIRSVDQVEIVGNQLIAADSIQAQLPLDYPQPLLAIQPQAIAHQLEKQGPIAQVTVSRHLIPPGLTVRVTERQPVAIVRPKHHTTAAGDSTTHSPSTAVTLTGAIDPSQAGLIDAYGFWMPLPATEAIPTSITLPNLTVRGLTPANQSDWPGLYDHIQSSGITVTEIDWRSASNLVLHTDTLGAVHLGPYAAHFPRQLATLNQMRNLPDQLNNQNFAYIDLRNPDAPAIQVAKP